MRDTSKEKQAIIVGKFHELLRCGASYTVQYMYEEAGKLGYVLPKTAGDIVRDYYHKVINDEMIACVDNYHEKTDKELLKQFQMEFKVCEREARFIIRFIRMRRR